MTRENKSHCPKWRADLSSSFLLFFCSNLVIWHIERVSCERKWSLSFSERESLQTLHTVTDLCHLQCLESCFACEGQPGWKTVRDPWSKASLRPSKERCMSLPSLYSISGVIKKELPHQGWEKPSETSSNSSGRENSNEDLEKRFNSI